MISAKQMKAARIFLDLDQKHVAEMTGLSTQTIHRMENLGTGRSSAENVEKVRKALEGAGIEFLPENGGGSGVRLRKSA